MTETPVAGDFFRKQEAPPLPPAPPVQQPDPDPEPPVEDRTADEPQAADETPAEKTGDSSPAKKAASKAPRAGRGSKTGAGRPGKRAPAAGQTEEDDPERQKVAIKVPIEIRDRLRLEQQVTKASFTDIALDAVALNLDEVKKKLASQRPARRQGGLFERVYTQRAVQDSSSDANPRVQINLFLYADDLATLETLSEEAGARDRTHFLNTALELHLKKEKKNKAGAENQQPAAS